MKNMIGKIAILGVVAVAASGCDQNSSPMSPSATSLIAPPQANTGNGAPSGAHYNLNLIGVPRNKTADMNGSTGGRIFIYFEGSTDILLREGDFRVLDANGTDGPASFQLPDPDNGEGQLAYSVWIRPVSGRVDASISFQTCFTETSTGGVWCYAGDLVQNLTRSNRFTDVSRDLLQVCADTDPTIVVDLNLVPLFSDLGTEYFWHVDNDGMRNVQMRFYPISTTPIGGECTRGPHPSH